ncbi:MAG: alpha-2-macroglobulin, partial [Solirubrobacterales bacterium]|nr:alpha-2-macroglobulin [Solirubrobacterales bacterium]
HVPWYSFFDWGWKAPLQWARAFWYEGREYQAPTALVDLAKPAFKLGVAAIEVGRAAHELQVSVTPDQPQYAVRGKALARVKVAQGGQPAAGAEIAFAAVDEGLLALRSNESWQLLAGLLQTRAWGVQTATAVSEVIGRRHYGRKAVAAGGGGGHGATRELFDTLLLWQGRIALDGRGEALVEVPLNDSLTSFRLVAVADDGAQRFGTGSASIRVSQDLQILPGLPPLVRDGDRFSALLTLRNTTAREMKLRVALQGRLQGAPGTLNLPPQELVLAAGSARELSWPVDVPADAQAIEWEAAADEQAGSGGARDRLKLSQRVGAAVPLRVQQATLLQLDGSAALPLTLPISRPEGALPGRGGMVVGLQPSLSGALPGLRRYFENYPFACLEQKVAKAVGLRDAALWAAVANALPTYLDADGLASYFPPRAEDAARGSDRLTAHLLSAAHEAGFELPPAARDRMLDGLAAFVEGRIERRLWSPRADLDVRKLAALEALSRHGRATPRMLGSINLVPNQWPTAALIDWLQILRRVKGIAEQPRRLDEAQQVLRARLAYAGTTLKFSNEEGDFWWWLMDSADANAAKLILALLDDPAWRDELPRLVVGALGRQQRGAWLTTTANVWGTLA